MHKFTKQIKEILMKNSDKVAYVWNNRNYTYGEIVEASLNLSEKLKNEEDNSIILYGHKSIRMVVSILACLFANKAYVPVDTYMPPARIKEILEQTKTSLIINNSEKSVSFMDMLTLEEIYEKNSLVNAIKNTSNDIAYIIFTSGSTGKPKGVPISYNNLENFVLWLNKLLPVSIDETLNVLNQASFSFDLSVADFYYTFLNGKTLIPLENIDVVNYNEIFNKLKNNKINMIVSTPTFLKLLMLQKDFCNVNYKDLKTIYLCGETLETNVAKEIMDRFPDLKLVNAYGPTEATSAVSGIVIEKEMLNENYLPVGRVSNSATEIFIQDNEIVLKGKSVFNGYLSNRIELSEYKTGDIGEIKNDLIYCYGRKDNQIKYKGYRIELDDIERNIEKIDEVEDAVVIAKYKENTKIVKFIKAYVILKKEATELDIKNKLNNTLPDYMIPQSVTILKEFPINNNGKIDRKKLSEL